MDSITTTRLTLRHPKPNDAPAIRRVINDWEVVRWLSRVPYPYQQTDAAEFIDKSKIAWAERNASRFVITLKNEIVGGIGLERHDKTLFDLGYWIARRHWNKGIATEAVFAIIDFAHKQLAASGITASCHEENHRSEKVLLNANFSRTGTGLRFSTALGKKVPEIQFSRYPADTDRSTSSSR
jgi:8-oxo-dGTP diphosphatase